MAALTLWHGGREVIARHLIEIENGRIFEDGTHGQLIPRRGRYHALYVNPFAHEREEALLGAAGGPNGV